MLKLFSILLVLVVLTASFFSFTDPEKLAVGWLMIPVLLVFGLFALTTYIILRLLFRRSDNKKLKSIAGLAGITGSLVLLFQSTGGIVLADVLLMSLILVITYLYINRY